MATDVQEFVSELDASVFEQKLAQALGEVSAAVVDNNAAGSVTVKFDFKRIGSSYQVMVKHKLSFSKPTPKGKASEENTTETPMYIGVNGYLSIFPEDQTQMFTKKGAINQEGSDENG